MQANDDDPFGLMIRKLDRLATLDASDSEAIRALPFTVKAVPAHQYLVRDGGKATECWVLLDGYACRHKLAANGGRQIVSFHVPGDIVDLQHLLLERADHNVQTITPARIAWIPIEALRALARERPAVGDALWRDTLIDASVFREWVLNIGRRDAKSRIAHMLCEFAVRREVLGLGPIEHFELPMTQEQIADATGLTSVHVCRMLAELSNNVLISRQGR